MIGDAPDLDRYNFTLPDAPYLSMPTDVADVQLSDVTTALVAPDFSNAPEMGALLALDLPDVPQIDWAVLGQVTELDVPPAPEAPDVTMLSDFSDLVRQQEVELRSSLDRILSETGGELRKLLPDFTQMREGAYNLIYNEWFRDENLVPSFPVNTGDGPDSDANYAILFRGKRHDYFTSCLPWPQKGPSVNLPLGSSAPVKSGGNLVSNAIDLQSSAGGFTRLRTLNDRPGQ